MSRKSTTMLDEMTITVPLGEVPLGAYCSTRLDLNLTEYQAKTLKRMIAGLDQARAILRDGRRVISGADAIRFILESEQSD